MKVIDARYEILDKIDGMEVLKKIERVARTCYKSEDYIKEGSAERLVKSLIDRGHEAMLEHYSFSIKFICDRGVSHEIVRHRVASFAQESTRYCNYSKDKFGKELTFIYPRFWDRYIGLKEEPNALNLYENWHTAMENAEKAYFTLLEKGATPQEARSVLPNSIKTEVVMTANLREWRHFFKLRTAPAAHPQMRELTIPLLKELKEKIPVMFDDIEG